MRSGAVTALVVAVSVVVAGCGQPPGDDSGPLPSDAAEVEDCGSERMTHGANVNVAGRECLLDAFMEGRPAVFVSDSVTVKGAPIRRTYRVLGPDLAEIEHDARQDPLGSGRIEFLRCTALVPVAEWNRSTGDEIAAEMVFVEDGCQPVGG